MRKKLKDHGTDGLVESYYEEEAKGFPSFTDESKKTIQRRKDKHWHSREKSSFADPTDALDFRLYHLEQAVRRVRERQIERPSDARIRALHVASDIVNSLEFDLDIDLLESIKRG